MLLPMAERSQGYPPQDKLNKRASVHAMAPIQGSKPSKPVPTMTSKKAPCSDDIPLAPRMLARAKAAKPRPRIGDSWKYSQAASHPSVLPDSVATSAASWPRKRYFNETSVACV